MFENKQKIVCNVRIEFVCYFEACKQFYGFYSLYFIATRQNRVLVDFIQISTQFLNDLRAIFLVGNIWDQKLWALKQLLIKKSTFLSGLIFVIFRHTVLYSLTYAFKANE